MKKKVVSMLLSGAILGSSAIGLASSERDLDAWLNERNTITSAWAKQQAVSSYNIGLLDGTSIKTDSNFTKGMSREGFVDISMNYLRNHVSEEKINSLKSSSVAPTFIDTSNQNVIDAAHIGFIHGTGNNKFEPNTTMNRETLATITNRVEKIINENEKDVNADIILKKYIDRCDISDWSRQSMANLSAKNILNGATNSTLNPKDEATKEQSLTVLLRGHELKKEGDRFNGKILTVIGDSIAYHDKLKEHGVKTIGFQSILEENFGFKSGAISNYPGKPVADRPQHSDNINSAGRHRGLSSMFKDGSKDWNELDNPQTDNYTDTDYMIIAGGTNDFGYDVPLGEYSQITKSERDIDNFYGAYSELVETLITKNPNMKIQLWTPFKRTSKTISTTTKNGQGFYLKDYSRAIKEIGEYFNVEVVDMYENSGLEESNLDQYTIDGLHPNNAGYNLLSKYAMSEFHKRY